MILHVVAVAALAAGGGVPMFFQILNAKTGCSQRVGLISFLYYWIEYAAGVEIAQYWGLHILEF